MLKGAGWANLEIVSGKATTVVEGISYCTNALDDLVRTGLDIATEKGIGGAIFDHEPALSALVADTSWIENDDWHSGARLSVIRNLSGWVEPSFRWRASVEAEAVFHLESQDELARLFLDMALGVRQEHGEDGYEKLWAGQRRYPRRAVTALEAALALPADTPYNYGT
jgi:hypothetical protein